MIASSVGGGTPGASPASIAYTPLAVPETQAEWPGNPASGAWSRRTQLVWDGGAGRLVRESFLAWDPQPELGLDFVWEPASEAAPGPIAGAGRLLWLKAGGAAYVRDDIVREYRGLMANGRPHGSGRMSWKTGLVYDGSWRDGEIAGTGVVRFANGDVYEGALAGGVGEGHGRYVEVDGTVFEGSFTGGVRDGPGTLTLPGGQTFRSVWRDGVEIERRPIGGTRIAQASGVSADVYIDTKLNAEFIDADIDMQSYAYTASPTDTGIFVTVDAPRIIELWKGSGVLDQESAWPFENPGQFSPVFLVVELGNDSNQTAAITSAWFDLAQSYTDYQPYIVLHAWEGTRFDPEFAFQNYGWGKALGARLYFSFGTDAGPVTGEFVSDLGDIDRYVDATVVDAMASLGLDVAALSNPDLPCPRPIDADNCAFEVSDFAPLLGELASAAFIDGPFLRTRLTGRLEYTWIDAAGAQQARASPVLMDLTLAFFGAHAEYGVPGPVERGFPTITLPLDQSGVRIPIPFTAELAPGEARRFALNFVAEKSSRHLFRFLFELADGTVTASPAVDLLYFKPRTFELN